MIRLKLRRSLENGCASKQMTLTKIQVMIFLHTHLEKVIQILRRPTQILVNQKKR